MSSIGTKSRDVLLQQNDGESRVKSREPESIQPGRSVRAFFLRIEPCARHESALFAHFEVAHFEKARHFVSKNVVLYSNLKKLDTEMPGFWAMSSRSVQLQNLRNRFPLFGSALAA